MKQFRVLSYLYWLPLLSLIWVVQSGCSAVRSGIRPKQFRQLVEESPVFSRYFTGFALYDPDTKQMVYEQNASRYFTPASNTKLFTFYTSLRMLGDSVPALQYIIQHDSLIFRGTGDPSLLHPDLQDTTAYGWLRGRTEQLFYAPANYAGFRFGPGWAWGDYNSAYSAEKSALPVYGNFVRVQIDSSGWALPQPAFFARYLKIGQAKPPLDDLLQRDEVTNVLTYYRDVSTKNSTLDIPFKTSPELTTVLLGDTLKRTVTLINQPTSTGWQTVYGIRADSLYRRMMQVSDNFIAEQLLLACASTLSDTLSSERTIAYAKQHFLNDLPDRPIWMDGSGLSRYNLFTPRSMIQLLSKIREIMPEERLYQILPAGGVSGTVKDSYKSDTGEPYIYAKTGTLSNNLCLSGYLLTKKGKTLLFSFMHNNHPLTTGEIKREMEKVLREIYEKY